MPLELTYAQIVGALGAAILFGPSNAPERTDGRDIEVAVTFGAVTEFGQLDDEPNSFATITARKDKVFYDRFDVVLGLGASDTGTVFGSVGIGKSFVLGPVNATLFAGPALYQADLGDGLSADEFLQFRSGVDLGVPITERISLSAGWYHLSNMRINESSADTDVTHLGMSVRF